MVASNDVNIAKGGQTRVFVQDAGSSPANPYNYIGCMQLDGLNEELGELTPVYCPSAEVAEKWEIVDSTAAQPGLPTTDFTQRMDRYLRDFMWDLRKRGCRFNLKIKLDSCGRPDDPDSFDSLILVNGVKMTAFNLPTLNPLSGDDNAALDITGSFQALSFDALRPVQFGEVADTVLLCEALDAVYSDQIQCGDCGVPSDGCQKAFVLTLACGGSPGLSSQIVYTADGTATWAAMDIPTLGGLSGNRLAAVGQRLVVVSEATRSHHHALMSDILAGTVSWTEVATGYVVGAGPRAIYSKSPSETFVAGAGGYIYLMDNPTSAVTVLADGSATTQPLNDIDGQSQVIVAVGGSNAVLVSLNKGATFTLKVGPAVGVNLTSVAVINKNVWWVGCGNGALYYTINGGDSWVLSSLTGASVITDIRFVDEIVGYVAVQVGGTSRVYRTADNGYTWHYQEPYLSGLPTAERYNVVVPCGYNNVLAAGRVSAAGDGIIAVAE